MKKILILCFLGDPTYPSGSISGTGGFNASVRDILNYLIDSNKFECVFITNTMWNHSKPAYEQISKKITLVRVSSKNKYSKINNEYTYDVSAFVSSVKHIIKDFTKISFIHSFYWLSGIVASELSDEYHIPFIHTTVSLSKEKLRNGFCSSVISQTEFENVFLKKASFILAITEEEKRLLSEQYDISKDKIIIEGQTVAEEFHTPIYDNYGIPSELDKNTLSLSSVNFIDEIISDEQWWNYKAFVYVGRITAIKGLDIIIKAWINLAQKFDRSIPSLWIIGNTPYEIEGFRKQLSVDLNVLKGFEAENKIIWWGYLSPAAISTLFLKAAVLVTHSAYESGGRMILEGLCQGIPVISTNTGFGKDYIANWMNGFVVEYGDIENLMLRMSHFIMNPFLSNVLGLNAKADFKRLETIWHHKVHIVRLYEALISEKTYADDTQEYSPIIEDAFAKGIVETYPYYYLHKTKDDIANIIQSYKKRERTEIISQSINKNNNGEVWEYNKEIVVKYVYSKLNKRTIWDFSQKNPVISEQKIIEDITSVCESASVLTPFLVDTKNSLIVMPYIEILTNNEILKNYLKIVECLNIIKECRCQKTPISIADYWANTKNNIRQLNNTLINEFFEKIPIEIRKHMDKISQPSDPGMFYSQYAQSVDGHIGLYRAELVLLPTYNWQTTEEGLDAAILLSDILFMDETLNPKEERKLLNSLSDAFGVSECKILEWSICKCADSFIETVIFEKADNKYSDVYYSILELFDHII